MTATLLKHVAVKNRRTSGFYYFTHIPMLSSTKSAMSLFEVLDIITTNDSH